MRYRKCIKIGKIASFQMNPHSKPISIWRLKQEQIYPHYIDGWVKSTRVVLRGLSCNFKGVSQLKLVNETITSKAYQDNIKSHIKLELECTMPQLFNKIKHLQ